MKFCQNCGAQCEDGVRFCAQCGATFESSQASSQNTGNYTYNQNVYANNVVYQNGPGHSITPRSIVMAVILTIVTCGIYGIYWQIKLNDEINWLANDPTATSGGMVVVLSIVTCGIYGMYWAYKMGEKCDMIKGINGSSAVLYLILSLLGFSIVSYCLMQDTINKAV